MDNGQAPASTTNSQQELTLDQIRLTKGQTKREKCLVSTCIVLFLVAVIFMILFVVFYLENKDKDKEPQHKEECNTLQCLQIASALSESIEPTVKPCDDFYQFACGKWMENNPIPPNKQFWENFQALNAKLLLSLRELLEVYDAEASAAIKTTRLFYSSCINTETLLLSSTQIDQNCRTGTAPWLKLIGTGGPNVFPTLDGAGWVDDNWTFNQILDRLPRKPDFSQPVLIYAHPIIHFSVDVDLLNSSKYILYISQTKDYDLTRFQFLGDRNAWALKTREASYYLAVVAMGADPTTALQDAKDLVDLEVMVAKATSPAPIDTKTAFTTMTLQNLTDRYPQFDWLSYVQREMSSVNITVTMDEEVATDSLDYFDQIFGIINNSSQRTLLNYCWSTIIQGYMNFAPKSTDTERQDICATHTKQFFPDVTSRLYIDTHFSDTTKTKVEDLIVDLQDAFKDILRETEWMSEQTRQIAVEKLEAIIDKVGYSEDLKNDTYLDEKTKDMVIDVEDVLSSAVSVGDNFHQAALRQLRQRHDRTKWVTGAADINAYYNPTTNSIIFPAAILQKPVYRDTVVDALIYGGIGFFIGHEITHGFDNKGASFDKDGNLYDWWQPEDLQEFERRGECMVEQYSQFHFPEVNMSVNGRLTLGENIADNGGLKEAYLAYKTMLTRKGKEDPSLPVLGYTPEQLFFIGTAQFWCVNMKKEVLPALLQDVHTPSKYRVIGPMQNSVEFSRAFQCPVGSYMNPEKKCHVW